MIGTGDTQMKRTSWYRAVSSVLILAGAEFAQAQPGPRLLEGEMRRGDLLWVKFADDQGVRLRAGRPGSTGNIALNAGAAPTLDAMAARGFLWSRAHQTVTEQQLDALRATAEQRAGRSAPDQNALFLLRVPPDQDPRQWIARLEARPEIEWVQGVELPAPLPLPPDFTSNQGYAAPPPAGIGTWVVDGLPGGNGQGVKFVDVEYGWNLNHQDLPAGIPLVGPTPVDPFNSPHHGTAVLGQIVSLHNSFGTRGLAAGATPMVAAANTSAGYNVGAAINIAVTALDPGDVILIEQQTFGPNYTGNPPGTQFGLIPSEWNRPTYDAIRTAVMNGIVVVEAAGNGAQNLDDPVYSVGNGGHWPFRPENDSGAIIVGAGSQGRTRLSFSNYGQTVDLQGWGQSITTTGYGDAWSIEGTNLLYTHGFGGTSGASPIVTSAVCVLQAAAKAALGGPLTAAQIKFFLRDTGTPQTGNLAEQIGPLPDVPAAIFAATNTTIDPPGPFELTSPADGATGVAAPVTLMWTAAADAVSYRIWLDNDSDFSSPIISGSEVLTPGYIIPAGLTQPLTTYYWAVQASNIGGDTSSTPVSASFTRAGEPPGPFTLISPPDGANIGTFTPTLAWSPSTGAESYTVTVSLLPDLSSPILVSAGVPTTSFLIPPVTLLNNVRYYWGVTAVNSLGQTASSSGVWTFAVLLPFCPGDANGDRVVNFGDVSSVLTNWGDDGPTGDANDDDSVDFVDITAVLVFWLTPCP